MAKKNNSLNWENNFGIPVESQVDIPEMDMKEYLKDMKMVQESEEGWVRAVLNNAASKRYGYDQILIQKNTEGEILQKIAVQVDKNNKIIAKINRETPTTYNYADKKNVIKQEQGFLRETYSGKTSSVSIVDRYGDDIITKKSTLGTPNMTKEQMRGVVVNETKKLIKQAEYEFAGGNLPNFDNKDRPIINKRKNMEILWFKNQKYLESAQVGDAMNRIADRYDVSFISNKARYDAAKKGKGRTRNYHETVDPISNQVIDMYFEDDEGEHTYSKDLQIIEDIKREAE